jgi:hypothetical protein
LRTTNSVRLEVKSVDFMMSSLKRRLKQMQSILEDTVLHQILNLEGRGSLFNPEDGECCSCGGTVRLSISKDTLDTANLEDRETCSSWRTLKPVYTGSLLFLMAVNAVYLENSEDVHRGDRECR